MANYLLYKMHDLLDYIVRFFTHLGVSEDDARISADILVAADLRGVESHGVIRLNSYYGSRLREGLIDLHSPLVTVSESPTTLVVDGGNGLGMVVAHKTMTHCIQKAQENNICFACVCNSNHYGIAGYYSMMALPYGMIGVSLTNSHPLVAPTYGRSAILGTNPISVAVPAGKERPYVLDMATSIVPIGRITVFDKSKKPIPEGWGIDSKGQVTTNPSDVLAGGALMPLGGEDIMRGYKGYGLSMLVDIFSGVLSGAAFGTDVASPSLNRTGSNVGHFFAAIKVDAFQPLIDFEVQMDRFIQMLKESPKAVDQERIYIAGEKEYERAEQNEKNGVPVMDEVVKMLSKGGQEIGVPWDLKPIG